MFAAIFNCDGKPVDAPRGGMSVKLLGRTGQAALLWSDSGLPRAAGEACTLHSLQARYWIVGRIRLDARHDLEKRLAPHVSGAETMPDALLCLQAYAAWGERFVDFLAGDFSFALWDDERQCLIGVRDQLGVRPLFHATDANTRMIGDSLDWLAARMPGRDLDEYWVADFLTLTFCREFERTVYRDIRRLAPAHIVTLSEAGEAVRRYWRLDIAEPIHFRDPRTYSETLRDLLARAIGDRLPAGRIGISMSGGLDSTTLAAMTVGTTGDAARVVAVCEHYERVMHIREDHFASLAAHRLGIELKVRAVDDLVHDPQWRSRDIRPAEPATSVLNAHNLRLINADLATLAPVWFEGEGPDNALVFERDAYLRWLLRRRSPGRLVAALVRYARVKGRAGWGQTMRRHAGPRQVREDDDVLPRWLRRDFADRLKLEQRIADLDEGGDASHPWHPRALASFTSPIWQSYFDEMAFQDSLAPVVRRHPFLDLRVLEFMLSVPPIPWGWKKRLMREAMRDRLPAELLAREKTPLACYPDITLMRAGGAPTIPAGSAAAAYVDATRLPPADAPDADLHMATTVLALDHWLTLGR